MSGRSPGEGNGNPFKVPLLEKSHGWRSLVGHSAWGREESDTTERLHFDDSSAALLNLLDCIKPRTPLTLNTRDLPLV